MPQPNQLRRSTQALTRRAGPDPLPIRRDQLPFAAQLTIWSWRLMGRAYPRLGPVAERVSRAYDIIGAPAAFPAMYALVCMVATNPARSEPPHCAACLTVSTTELRLLAVIRHLQRGNDALAERAIARLVDDFHLELALHYARLYSCEMAAVGQTVVEQSLAAGVQP